MRLRNVSILALVMLVVSFSCYGKVVCDFDGDNSIKTSDAAILLAWIIESNYKIKDPGYLVTESNVQIRAENMLDTNVVVSRLPDSEDLLADSNGDLSLTDAAYLLAFIVENNFAIKTGGVVRFDSVSIRAAGILSLSASLSKLPGTPIGDSSFSTTITGITTDP